MENEAKYLIRNWELPNGELMKYDVIVYKDITKEQFQKMMDLIYENLKNGNK